MLFVPLCLLAAVSARSVVTKTDNSASTYKSLFDCTANCGMQMYLNNTNTIQGGFPVWATVTPDYTFLVPYLNAVAMPDLWSYNVGWLCSLSRLVAKYIWSRFTLLFLCIMVDQYTFVFCAAFRH